MRKWVYRIRASFFLRFRAAFSSPRVCTSQEQKPHCARRARSGILDSQSWICVPYTTTALLSQVQSAGSGDAVPGQSEGFRSAESCPGAIGGRCGHRSHSPRKSTTAARKSQCRFGGARGPDLLCPLLFYSNLPLITGGHGTTLHREWTMGDGADDRATQQTVRSWRESTAARSSFYVTTEKACCRRDSSVSSWMGWPDKKYLSRFLIMSYSY